MTDVARGTRSQGTTRPSGASLDDAMGRTPGRKQRADTVFADVQGFIHGRPPLTAPAWPLVEALRRPYSQTEPLVWLDQLPTSERPALEKAALTGTTVRVSAGLGTQTTIAAYTDVSIQASSTPAAMASILATLAVVVARDADRHVATTLAAGATSVNDAGAALAAVMAWPGPRLVVLGATGIGEINRWADYEAASGGAIRVLVDPYISPCLVIATAGVAVGVMGPSGLMAQVPSLAGTDVAESVTIAIAQAPGAVSTWMASAGGTGGASYVDDLLDADTSTDPPEEGETLVWDPVAGQWVPGEPNLDRRDDAGTAT